MTPAAPVIAIVTGSGQTPSHYAELISHLHHAGHPTCCTILPSVGASDPCTAAQDATYIRERMLLPFLDTEHRDVILLMHSYGSIPGSAAAKGLSKQERQAEGKATGVVGQIFVAALVAREGESLLGMMGGELPSFLTVAPGTDLITCEDPTPIIYHDVPELQAAAARASCLGHSYTSFASPSPPGSWQDEGYQGRLAYIQTANDMSVPRSLQDAMLDGSGVCWKRSVIDSGHSPQLSRPGVLSELVLEFAKEFET